MNVKSALGPLLFLWIGLGLTATGQTSPPPAEISGAYDCSAPGFAKQKLIFLSGGRWVKGPRFDPAAFKMQSASFKTGPYSGRLVFLRRNPARQGEFRLEKDRVVLYPSQPGVKKLEWQAFLNAFVPDAALTFPQQFRIDPASGNLIEIPFGAFQPQVTCTRDGFF